MNYLILFYFILSLSLFILLAFRLLYKNLLHTKAYINDVTHECNHKGNLLYLSFFIETSIDKYKKNTRKTIVLKKKLFFKKNKYISDYCDLKGKFVNYYYLPFFKKYGYLDSKLFLIPIWVYVLSLFVFTIPLYFILCVLQS